MTFPAVLLRSFVISREAEKSSTIIKPIIQDSSHSFGMTTLLNMTHSRRGEGTFSTSSPLGERIEVRGETKCRIQFSSLAATNGHEGLLRRKERALFNSLIIQLIFPAICSTIKHGDGPVTGNVRKVFLGASCRQIHCTEQRTERSIYDEREKKNTDC